MSQLRIKNDDIVSVDASKVTNPSTFGFENAGVASGLITSLKDGVDAAGDTLNKLYNLILNKVDKVTGKSLIDDTEITRLAALTAPYPQTDDATASGTITLSTNTVTNLTNTGTGTFTIAFGSPTANKANDYGFVLRIGGTLRTVNWDANIVWKDGTAPTLAINKSYYFVSSKLGSQYLTAFNTF